MTGRPPLPVGESGRISSQSRPPKAWTRFRDLDGVVRVVSATGRNRSDAERRLKAKLAERSSPADTEINGDTTLAALGVVWLSEVDDSARAANTKQRYREIVESVIAPAMGELRAREVTPARLGRHLRVIAETRGWATAKLARANLRGMLALVVANDDGVHRNAARETSLPARESTAKLRDPQSAPAGALGLSDVQALRAALRADKRAVRADLVALVDVLLGTGIRPGEALALRWSDLELAPDEGAPYLEVTGTIVRVKGQGLIRQDHPKSRAGHRRLYLPRFVVDTLLARQLGAEPNPYDVVFPSSAGTLRDPTNMRDQWRDARVRHGWGNVTPRTLRKTAATLIEASEGLEAARGQLGHTSVSTTERHYVTRAREARDNRHVLDAIADLSEDVSAHLVADKNVD